MRRTLKHHWENYWILSSALLAAVIVTLVFLTTSCTQKSSKTQIYIYTALYNHVVQKYDEELKKAFPEIEFKWYQSGSENVAAKLAAEMAAGKIQADLLMTSDVFSFEELKAKNALFAYDSPLFKNYPDAFQDPDHHWFTSRHSIMVLAYHSDVLTPEQAPKSWKDLEAPRFKDKLVMANPLESGTTYTSVAMLESKFGWDYFKRLRANSILASGGNSAVIGRLESKEKAVGIVLLENVLAARKKNPKLVAVYPSEGVITIPGLIGILSATKNPEIAKKVYDFFLSPKGQEILVQGDIHPIDKQLGGPAGTKSWAEIEKSALPWSMNFLREALAKRSETKQKFSQIVLE